MTHYKATPRYKITAPLNDNRPLNEIYANRLDTLAATLSDPIIRFNQEVERKHRRNTMIKIYLYILIAALLAALIVYAVLNLEVRAL